MRAAAAAPATASLTFCIAPDHPALPGHFPGAPIVPGALLLAEALQRLGSALNAPLRCQRIDSAKFFRPVAAGAPVTVNLTLSERGQGRIDLSVAGVLVAQAAVTVALAVESCAHE